MSAHAWGGAHNHAGVAVPVDSVVHVPEHHEVAGAVDGVEADGAVDGAHVRGGQGGRREHRLAVQGCPQCCVAIQLLV